MDEVVNKNKHHFELMILVVIFIVFFGIGLFLLNQKGGKNSEKKSETTTEKDQNSLKEMKESPEDTTSPRMTLETAEDVKMYEKGERIDLVLKGNSKGEDINGFDVLVGFDSTNMEMIETKPASKTFQIFTFPNQGYVSVTAAKLLDIKQPSAFDNTDILTLSFKAKKAGIYTFSIEKQKGNERTKFVNSSAKILVPLLNSIEVEVR